jgi:hypothetical protein
MVGGWRGRSEPVRQCCEIRVGLSELDSAQMRAHKPSSGNSAKVIALGCNGVRFAFHFAVLPGMRGMRPRRLTPRSGGALDKA